MTTEKFDYLIEAVRYDSNGMIEQVRLYERRGPTFSDRTIYDRTRLVEVLMKKKKVATGKRINQLASTFNVQDHVAISGDKAKNILHLADQTSDHDSLGSLPLF